VYGFYILIFPLALSVLLNNLVDYLIIRSDFTKRLRDFETALGLENPRSDIASARHTEVRISGSFSVSPP